MPVLYRGSAVTKG